MYVLAVLACLSTGDGPPKCQVLEFATRYPSKSECVEVAQTLPEPFGEVYEGWAILRLRCAPEEAPSGEES